MLISFEGQDGVGKTALIQGVHDELAQHGVGSVVVEEFSDSPYGEPLIEAVARDKFLRPTSGEVATCWTRALEEITDLYYLDERVIGPELVRGVVVLKDRHYDTLLYTLAPLLVESGAVTNQDAALVWLRASLSHLQHWPNKTIYVDAPLEVRVRRIERRKRHLAEANADRVSAADLRVFTQRDQVAHRIIREERSRFLLLDNGNRPLVEGVEEVVSLVRAYRAQWAVCQGKWRHGS